MIAGGGSAAKTCRARAGVTERSPVRQGLYRHFASVDVRLASLPVEYGETRRNPCGVQRHLTLPGLLNFEVNLDDIVIFGATARPICPDVPTSVKHPVASVTCTRINSTSQSSVIDLFFICFRHYAQRGA